MVYANKLKGDDYESIGVDFRKEVLEEARKPISELLPNTMVQLFKVNGVISKRGIKILS